MRSRSVVRVLSSVLALALLLSCGGGDGVPGPDPVEGFVASFVRSPWHVELDWSTHADPGVVGVLLVRRLGGPVVEAPVNGLPYVGGETFPGGDEVVGGAVAGPFTDTECPSGEVHYAAFAHDADGNYGAPARATAHVPNLTYFIGDVVTDGSSELFLADVDQPGVAQRLHASLRAGSSATPSAENDTYAFYETDHDIAGHRELYASRFDTPGASVKVSGTLPLGTTITKVVASPAETHVLYRADATTAGTQELYLVDMSTPGTASKVNGALPGGAEVTHRFGFSPDGALLFYVADEMAVGRDDLFVAGVSPASPTVKVNAPLVVGGDVTQARVASDNQHVLYVADQLTNDEFGLFRVNLSSPGSSASVNSGLVPGGDVAGFRISPDAQWVAYQADQAVDDQDEVWIRPMDLSVAATRVNPPLGLATMDVVSPHFAPDSQSLFYASDEVTDGQTEIFWASTTAPGTSQRLNAPLQANGHVAIALWDRRGDRVVYVADQDTDNLYETYVVDVAAPGAATKVSGTPAAGAVSTAFACFSRDGRSVYYVADQTTAGVFEVWATRLSAPGAPVRVSPTLVAGGDVHMVYPVPIEHMKRQLGP